MSTVLDDLNKIIFDLERRYGNNLKIKVIEVTRPVYLGIIKEYEGLRIPDSEKYMDYLYFKDIKIENKTYSESEAIHK